MEWNISDLLDDLSEVPVDIAHKAKGSEHRIRALTMEKIRTAPPPRRGLSWIGKVLVAAAIIAMLAVPALAASGFSITDWMEGLGKSPEPPSQPNLEVVTDMDRILNNTTEYDQSTLFGGKAKKWSASGWVMELRAEDATETGLTFCCDVISVEEDATACSFSNGWWMEVWNGSGYEPMDLIFSDDSATPLQRDDKLSLKISWAEALPSGCYRLGKTFTTGDKEYTFYAKFRLFGPDMAVHLDKVYATLDALETQQVKHLTFTYYDCENRAEYAYYTTEIWQHGSDWLEESRYVRDDGSLLWHSGTLFRDGKGFKILWSEPDPTSPLAYWRGYSDAKTDRWEFWFTPVDELVGQIDVRDDGLRVIEFSEHQSIEGSGLTKEQILADRPLYFHDYTLLDYLWNADGALISATVSRATELEAERVIRTSLVVHDTPAEEIAQVIASQKLGAAHTFSWEEEQAALIPGSEGIQAAFFKNTQEQVIFRDSDLINLAKAEAPVSNVASCFLYRDADAQMWKVVLNTDRGRFTVYMNSNGITRLMLTQ